MVDPVITNHALERYIERVLKEDPAAYDVQQRVALRANLTTRAMILACAFGARTYKNNGVDFVVMNNKVVTVKIHKDMPRSVPRLKRKSKLKNHKRTRGGSHRRRKY